MYIHDKTYCNCNIDFIYILTINTGSVSNQHNYLPITFISFQLGTNYFFPIVFESHLLLGRLEGQIGLHHRN